MTEFEKELVRFVSGYLDAGVSAEDYVKAFSQRLLDSIGRQSKPKVCEGLEEEYKDYVESDPVYSKLVNRNAGLSIARHFAEWGAEHRGCSEIPTDLEEASQEYEKKHTYQRYDGGGLTPEYDATLAEAVIFGAKWQKEQDDKELSEKIAAAYQLGLSDKEKMMLKEAVEGIAVINANAKDDGFGYVRSDYVTDDFLRGLGNFKIIIVKED